MLNQKYLFWAYSQLFYFSMVLTILFRQKLIRLCGEVLATPTENEEIQFLCIVCAKLKQDPYLVNFFLEVRGLHTSLTGMFAMEQAS